MTMFMEPNYQNVATFLTILVGIAFSGGIKIDSVGLTSGLPYAKNGSSAHFSFNVTLEPNEEILSVLWTKDNETGSYEWTKEGVKAVGVFSVAQHSAAGEFILNPVEFHQAGKYLVTVSTNRATEASNFEFVVYYSSGLSLTSNSPTFPMLPKSQCLWKIIVNVNHIYPYPNITCIFDGGVRVADISKSTENITDLKDGTFSYNMKANITIANIPVESFITCNNWIKDAAIQMLSIKDSLVSGMPCRDPPGRIEYTHKMDSGLESCYGGYVPLTKFNYSCAGRTPQKTLQCKEGIWIELDSNPWPDCSQFNSHNYESPMSTANRIQIKESPMSTANRIQIKGFWLSTVAFIVLNAISS